MPKEARIEISKPVVVVQEVSVIWTKASRGGKGATLRNAVPEAVSIPLHLSSQDPDIARLHHERCYSEHRGWSTIGEKLTETRSHEMLTIGCVTIDPVVQGVLRATYAYNEMCGGQPHRDDFRRSLRLSVSQWGQIVYNGRFDQYDGGSWHYEKKVVNIGLFERATVVPSLFTRVAPNERLSVMALLI